MRVAFWCSDKPHESILGEEFLEGLRQHGDEGIIRRVEDDFSVGNYDVACMVGVKSRLLFQAHVKAGVRVIYFDKGYLRHRRPGIRVWEYWRTSIDRHTPAEWLGSAKMPTDRMVNQGLTFAPWRSGGSTIIFAGSSSKYHEFVGLKHPTFFAKTWTKRIRSISSDQIIYRPKPSWRDATPIAGTIYSESPENLGTLFENARVLVTHGSNACFDAVCAGVPCIVLGEGAAKAISSTDISDIAAPFMASDEVRSQWLANIAYCQWTMSEMASGEAWQSLRRQLFG